MAPADRAEQLRQRLAAKAESRSGGGSKDGPLLPLPAPKTIVTQGLPISWFLWFATSALLLAALLLGTNGLLVAWSLLHAAYFAIFSRTNVALQVRVVFLVMAVLGALTPLKVLIYVQLLAICSADVAVGYRVLERLLYCIPANRPENPEDFSIDFVIRLITEPPRGHIQAFSVKAGASKAPDFELTAKSRAERRKK